MPLVTCEASLLILFPAVALLFLPELLFPAAIFLSKDEDELLAVFFLELFLFLDDSRNFCLNKTVSPACWLFIECIVLLYLGKLSFWRALYPETRRFNLSRAAGCPLGPPELETRDPTPAPPPPVVNGPCVRERLEFGCPTTDDDPVCC